MSALTILIAKLHELSTAISLKIGTKLGKTEQAADSLKLGGKTLTEVSALSAPHVFLIKIRLASSDAEVTSLKAAPEKTDIVDTRDQTVWRWNATVYVNAGKVTTVGVMVRDMLYKNTVGTQAAYYLDNTGTWVTLGAPSAP